MHCRNREIGSLSFNNGAIASFSGAFNALFSMLFSFTGAVVSRCAPGV